MYNEYNGEINNNTIMDTMTILHSFARNITIALRLNNDKFSEETLDTIAGLVSQGTITDRELLMAEGIVSLLQSDCDNLYGAALVDQSQRIMAWRMIAKCIRDKMRVAHRA